MAPPTDNVFAGLAQSAAVDPAAVSRSEEANGPTSHTAHTAAPADVQEGARSDSPTDVHQRTPPPCKTANSPLRPDAVAFTPGRFQPTAQAVQVSLHSSQAQPPCTDVPRPFAAAGQKQGRGIPPRRAKPDNLAHQASQPSPRVRHRLGRAQAPKQPDAGRCSSPARAWVCLCLVVHWLLACAAACR